MDTKASKLMEAIEVNGASFIGIDTLTDVKLKGGKSNPMQARVQKHVEGSTVMVFSNTNKSGYGEMVKRRLAQEGKDPNNFELKPLSWGQRVPNTPFIENKGKYYLQVVFLNPGKTTYLLDGKPINKEDIVGLESKDESKQGGLDNKVFVRAYKVDSILAVRANGQTLITF